MEAAPAEETSLDEAQIIYLIRALLPSRASELAHPELRDQAATTREQAGTLLWDFSVIPAVADVMVTAGMIFQVLEALLSSELLQQQQEGEVLQAVAAAVPALDTAGPARPYTPPLPAAVVQAVSAAAVTVNVAAAGGGTPEPQAPHRLPHAAGDPERPVEVALGLLANLASHDGLAQRLASPEHLALVDLVCGPALHTLSSSAALSELCRLCSTALRKPGGEAWLVRLSGADAAQRLCWVAWRARDSVLHARAMDLLVALLHKHLLSLQPDDDQQPHAHQRGQPTHTNGACRQGPGSPDSDSSNPLSCAWHLLQAGLLDLVRLELKQAVEQVGPSSDGARSGASAWADLTPAPSVAAGSSVAARPHSGALRTPFQQPHQARADPSASGARAPRVPEHTSSHQEPGRSVQGIPTGNGLPAQLAAAALPEAAEAPPAALSALPPVTQLPMSEASVDAALRAIEVLGALAPHEGGAGHSATQGQQGSGTPPGAEPGGGAGPVCLGDPAVHAALLTDNTLAQHVVKLLGCGPGEQVLASTLLALQALDHSAVCALAGNTVENCNALLDTLGELPFGERGAWQREVVLYLLARTLRHLTTPPAARQLRQDSSSGTTCHQTAGGEGSLEAGADSGDQQEQDMVAAEGPTVPLAASLQATTQDLVDLAQRVEGLAQESCGVSGEHVQGYLRSCTRSMLVLLEPHAGRTASGRLRTAVHKQCLALKEKLAAPGPNNSQPTAA